MTICGTEPSTPTGKGAEDKEDPEVAEKVVLRIAVGSKNPCKLDAVRQAFERALVISPDSETEMKYEFDLQGFDVESGVDHQPFGDDETLTGAKNRAKSAYLAYRKQEDTFPHFAVGLEGGLEWVSLSPQVMESNAGEDGEKDSGFTGSSSKKSKRLFCMAWLAIYGRRTGHVIDQFASSDTKTYSGDKKPVFGLAKTAMFLMPPEITRLISEEGLELGDADDKFFGRTKSKHGSGTVGVLTDGIIDRAEYYEHALVLALTPWIRADVYPDGATK